MHVSDAYLCGILGRNSCVEFWDEILLRGEECKTRKN